MIKMVMILIIILIMMKKYIYKNLINIKKIYWNKDMTKKWKNLFQ